ncbi:MAG: hypothetical protein VB071_06775, partial [Lawsonibacter sp.]|nr:hypothetical protein [Lawsonibacter sp.]
MEKRSNYISFEVSKQAVFIPDGAPVCCKSNIENKLAWILKKTNPEYPNSVLVVDDNREPYWRFVEMWRMEYNGQTP